MSRYLGSLEDFSPHYTEILGGCDYCGGGGGKDDNDIDVLLKDHNFNISQGPSMEKRQSMFNGSGSSTFNKEDKEVDTDYSKSSKEEQEHHRKVTSDMYKSYPDDISILGDKLTFGDRLSFDDKLSSGDRKSRDNNLLDIISKD